MYYIIYINRNIETSYVVLALTYLHQGEDTLHEIGLKVLPDGPEHLPEVSARQVADGGSVPEGRDVTSGVRGEGANPDVTAGGRLEGTQQRDQLHLQGEQCLTTKPIRLRPKRLLHNDRGSRGKEN